MSNIIITGGAGFIGSHLADALAKGDHQITIIDNLDPYYSIKIKRKNLDIVLKNKNVKFIKGDIRDQQILKKGITKDTEFIFHEAAKAGVRASVENPYIVNDVNVLGALNILKRAREVDVTRVINASSSSVYGKTKNLPFIETYQTQPISPYAVSKLAVEHYCRVFYEVYGIPTVSLRYFTVYGPRMRPDLAINKFTKKMLKNEPIDVFGDGTQTRDFTYIDDVVEANKKLLKTKRADGKVMNIGTGKRTDINDMIDRLKKITGSSSKINHIEDQKGDAKHTLANIRLARRMIGYKPTIEFSEGLTRYVSWYKQVK